MTSSCQSHCRQNLRDTISSLIVLLFLTCPVFGAAPVQRPLSIALIAPESNDRAAFDTSSIFVRHAPSYLECRIPSDWGFVGGGTDSTSRFDWAHVGAIYIRNGFRGYNRWLAGTPIDLTEHEDPCLRVSNDGINWSVFTDGSHTCRDPLFTRDSCQYRGHSATYLSDTDLLMGKDGKIWIIWRATYDSEDSTFHSLWVSSTLDGYTWSPATRILGWWLDARVGPRLSPAWWIDQNGNYRMWVVQSNPNAPDSNIIELWKSPKPDYGWGLIDTVKQVGSNQAWVGAGDIKVGGGWHPEVIDYSGGRKIVLLVNAYSGSPNYRSLYIGESPDDGYTLDMRFEPLLTPQDTLASALSNPPWDSRVLYRSTAYWVTEGQDSVLEMVYIGSTPALPGTGGLVGGHWRMGLTHINRADKIQIRLDSLSMHPGDVVSLPISLTNPQDSIASFSLTLVNSRPEILALDSLVQTAGTLTSGWELHTEVDNSLGHSVLHINGTATNPVGMMGGVIAPSDLTQTLLNIRLTALHIADTVSNRVASINIDRSVHATAFSHPFGNPVAIVPTIHTDTVCLQCAQWDGADCLEWLPGIAPNCDSFAVLVDTTIGYDADAAYFKDGTVTVLECSLIPLSGDIDNDGSAFTDLDRIALQSFATSHLPALADARNADLDGDCLVGWSDLAEFDKYRTYGTDSVSLKVCTCAQPVWSCCDGYRGNVNNDPSQQVDLSDLSLLIAFLITHAPLTCPAEANLIGSASIDLSDLSFLVAYLTTTPRPTLPVCP